MISYAQNAEDVILARAFAEQSTGVYVDVGACHPTEHSVTRHFYDLGWSGVNIEPVQAYHAALARERPRDTNLCIAIGNSRREQTLYSFTATGLSTLVPSTAEDEQARSVYLVATEQWPCAEDDEH